MTAIEHYHSLLNRAETNRKLHDDAPQWQRIDEQACDIAWLLAFGIDGNYGQRYRAEAQAAK